MAVERDLRRRASAPLPAEIGAADADFRRASVDHGGGPGSGGGSGPLSLDGGGVSAGMGAPGSIRSDAAQSEGPDASDLGSLDGEVDDLAGDGHSDAGGSMDAQDDDWEAVNDPNPAATALAEKIRHARALQRQARYGELGLIDKIKDRRKGWDEHTRDLAAAQQSRALGAGAGGEDDEFALVAPDAPHVRRAARVAEIERNRRAEAGLPEPEEIASPGTGKKMARGLLKGLNKAGKLMKHPNTAYKAVGHVDSTLDAVNGATQLAGVGQVVTPLKHLNLGGGVTLSSLRLDTGLPGMGGSTASFGLKSAGAMLEHGGRALRAAAGAGMEKVKKPEEVGTEQREEIKRIQDALDEIRAREAAGIAMTPAMQKIKFRHMVNLEKYSRSLGKTVQSEGLHSNYERSMEETAAVAGAEAKRVWNPEKKRWDLSFVGSDTSLKDEVEGGRAAQNSKWRQFGRGLRGLGRVMNHTDKGEEELVEGDYGQAGMKALGAAAVRVGEDLGGSVIAPIGGRYVAKAGMMGAGLLTEGLGNVIAHAAGQETAHRQDLVDLANKYNHGKKVTTDADGNRVEEQVSTRREDILSRGYVPRKQEGPTISAEKAGLAKTDYTTRWGGWRGRAANWIADHGGRRIASVLNRFLPFGRIAGGAKKAGGVVGKGLRALRRKVAGSSATRLTPEQSAEQIVQARDLAAAPGGSIRNGESAYEAKYGAYLAARRARAAARGTGAVGAGIAGAGGAPDVDDHAASSVSQDEIGSSLAGEDGGDSLAGDDLGPGVDPGPALAGSGANAGDPRAAVNLDDIQPELDDERV